MKASKRPGRDLSGTKGSMCRPSATAHCCPLPTSDYVVVDPRGRKVEARRAAGRSIRTERGSLRASLRRPRSRVMASSVLGASVVEPGVRIVALDKDWAPSPVAALLMGGLVEPHVTERQRRRASRRSGAMGRRNSLSSSEKRRASIGASAQMARSLPWGRNISDRGASGVGAGCGEDDHLVPAGVEGEHGGLHRGQPRPP